MGLEGQFGNIPQFFLLKSTVVIRSLIKFGKGQICLPNSDCKYYFAKILKLKALININQISFWSIQLDTNTHYIHFFVFYIFQAFRKYLLFLDFVLRFILTVLNVYSLQYIPTWNDSYFFFSQNLPLNAMLTKNKWYQIIVTLNSSKIHSSIETWLLLFNATFLDV